MKRHVAAALIAAGLLAVAGCSSNGLPKDKESADPATAVLKTARTYQEAANRLDWKTACGMSSARLRGGTVALCVTDHAVTTSPPTSPAATSPSTTVSPPTYADGSTPAPIASSTPSGPDRADTGPVSAGDLVTTPATGDHPAGYGVMVTYTYTWPGKAAETTRRALRLVDEGGAWVVDQHEDIQDGDTGHGSPVLAALSRG